MTSAQRREQLIEVSRSLFAQFGFDATSVEEIAATAQVSKPVVYEHFGGKEGLYAVVVDRASRTLLEAIRSALTVEGASSRELIQQGAMALLDYIDEQPDGFRILARDSSVGSSGGSFASILSDIAGSVEDLLAEPFERHGFNSEFAGMYAQALVGLVAMAGQSWLDVREPPKEVVAAHLVNLAWNGMRNLEIDPELVTSRQ
ncbi:TetR/AcrR family transcriptional regulator [Aestuariimicrobium ganziense]|uniref:TetR/AcrR family transcriptional regulator n=1 Tax=Aestuariimicrobium ganziense TaxID=2773677 RepID=UPI0019416839|nr:TetR/AcrR family transcriptional regulator [Aestuariimicrobium ganziense]